MSDLRFEILQSGPILTGKGPEIVQAELDRAMELAVNLLLREVKKDTPVGVRGAEGGLLSTIQSDIIGKGTPVSIGIVATTSKYGRPVELGTKPHMPPSSALVPWVKKFLGYEGKKADRVAFALAKAIAKRGTEGRYMFESAAMEKEDAVRRIFMKAGFEISKKLGGVWL
ncbi:MAG: hypothetical protein HPY65_07790 [Syntrophaceae bacterium]|nr:hypothetical protein [Syntrophaceae bacterium]